MIHGAIFMTKSELINRLSKAGYYSIADYVRHNYLPGFTSVTIKQIMEYCRMHSYRTAGDILEMYLESQDDDD